MTFACEFFVHGEPKAQPRPRACRFGDKARVHNKLSPKARLWRRMVEFEAARNKPVSPLDGPLRISLHFFMPRPRSHYRTAKGVLVPRSDRPDIHTSKPDLDNLQKLVMDAMTSVGFWGDDRQVAEINASKRYIGTAGAFGVHVVVEEIEP